MSNSDVPQTQTTERRIRLRLLRQTPFIQEIPIPQLYPVVWRGILALKKHRAAVMMHYVSGNMNITNEILTTHFQGKEPSSPLRIRQRKRIALLPMEAIRQRLQRKSKYCILLALPCGINASDLQQQVSNMERGFISYFNRRQAAGIISVTSVGHQMPTFIVHIFPPCEFTEECLSNSNALQIVQNTTPLVLVIAAT